MGGMEAGIRGVGELVSERAGAAALRASNGIVDSRDDLTVVLAIDLRQTCRIRWSGCEYGAPDVFHERERVAWAPQAEDADRLVVGVGEGMPDTSGGKDEAAGRSQSWIVATDDHRERPVKDVDGLVEIMVDVWWRTGESRRHRQLANGQTRALTEYSQCFAGIRDDSHRLW
jgi:hypothetical protein